MCCVALLFAGSSYSQGDIDALIGYLASALAILYVRIRLRPAAWEEADAPASTVGGRS